MTLLANMIELMAECCVLGFLGISCVTFGAGIQLMSRCKCHVNPPAPPRAHLPGHGVHDLRQPQARGAERSPPLLQQGGEDRGGGVSGGQHPQAASTLPPRLHRQSDSSPHPELNDQLSMFDVQQQCTVNALYYTINVRTLTMKLLSINQSVNEKKQIRCAPLVSIR